MEEQTTPHPFSGFVRAVARGETLSQPLTEAEAETAMAQIISGDVEPVQLGAFLGVLRYRKETAAELAGFVRATRKSMHFGDGIAVDLDWPSYADRHKQLPYFLLAALVLARNGVRIAMHGISGSGPVGTPAVLDALGITPATSPEAATAALDSNGLAYVPISALCPPLAEVFALRRLLGVRSAVNSFARALNPFNAAAQVLGIFHPTYAPTHAELATRLGQDRAVIFKGGGGEAQRNPDKPCRLVVAEAGRLSEETWPALTGGSRFAWRDETLEPDRVAALWRGERQDAAPEAAVVGTLAVALRALARTADWQDAQTQAEKLWHTRNHKVEG